LVHTQAPFEHEVPKRQVTPQAPQFWLLVLVSTQFKPHWVWPAGQLARHMPLLQNWPGSQVVPQPPQLSASMASSTHLLLQSVDPCGHRQLAAVHTVPPVQTMPQAPQ
jgi:hypothetical protein